MPIDMPSACAFCGSTSSPDRSFLRIDRDGVVEVVCSARPCIDKFYKEIEDGKQRAQQQWWE